MIRRESSTEERPCTIYTYFPALSHENLPVCPLCGFGHWSYLAFIAAHIVDAVAPAGRRGGLAVVALALRHYIRRDPKTSLLLNSKKVPPSNLTHFITHYSPLFVVVC